MAARKCSGNQHTEACSYLHQNRHDGMTAALTLAMPDGFGARPVTAPIPSTGIPSRTRALEERLNSNDSITISQLEQLLWPAATFSAWKVPLAKAATVTPGNAVRKPIGPGRHQGLPQLHISRGRPALKAVQLHLCITTLGLVRPMNAKRIWTGSRGFYQWQAKTEQV